MTKHRNENSGSRQSVFERLDGKSSTKSVVYCSSWLKTGTCPNGKNCKYVGSHINLSASDSRDTSKPGSAIHHSKSKMKPHSSSKSGKERSSPDQNWDNWDQSDLEYADEKMLEKRLELLRRELLNAEVKAAPAPRSKHHSRSKHKLVTEKKKRKHSSSSSSSSSSSGSSSSQSSSSSSSSEEAQSTARYKQHRRSVSSSPSPKHKPRSFQKHNKEKRVSPEKKVIRNPKGFATKGNHKKSPPVKSSRHRTPPLKRKASPVKQNRAPATKKEKGRSAYSPPPHKRDRKSHSPRDRRHSPKRPPRTPHVPHKTPPVRDNRNPRGNVQRKSPPVRRNMDRNIDNRGNKQQKNVKGRFDKNNKDDNRRNLVHDKREDERLREKCRLLREAEMEKERRKSPAQDKGRDGKKRGDVERRDKDRDVNTKRDNRVVEAAPVRRHKEVDRFSKTPRASPPVKTSHLPPRGDDRKGRVALNSARTPAQGRLMDRIMERKNYLGDKEKRVEKDRLRDRGLDRVHSGHVSRAGSREFEPGTSGLRGREDTRFPSDERSPSVKYPEERHKWETRARSQEDDGDWERKYNDAPNKWDRNNRRNDWERKKDWGTGEWNDGIEWPPGGRNARATRGGLSLSSGPEESRRPLHKREMKGRSGEELKEVLSDISDDADEILNRDEETFNSDVDSVSDNEPDFKISTLICGPMQDPLTQRLLADDLDLDLEEGSDEDLDAKTSISDALGVDWASLVQETKPVSSSQEETGSAKKRWEAAQIFARLGISEVFAGKDTVERLKKKYGLDKTASASTKEPGESQELELLHSMPGVHSALREKIKARRQLFDPTRRALHARHDLSIRKQVCGFPASLLQQTAVTTAIAS